MYNAIEAPPVSHAIQVAMFSLFTWLFRVPKSLQESVPRLLHKRNAHANIVISQRFIPFRKEAGFLLYRPIKTSSEVKIVI